MSYRHTRVLTTVEEDFRRIGLLPPLNESRRQRQLSEVDDPAVPRDIPSPDPSTLAGLDASGGDKSANTKTAKQPKPKMGPADDDSDVMDPLEDGGSKGAHKQKGGYKAVAGGKEASIKGEGKGYMLSKKGVGPKGKGKNKGQAPAMAQGLKPAKRIGGMHKGGKMESTGTLGKAASLIEEVEGLLRGVQIDEQVDNLMRGFRLVSEDAALLADRLTEMSDTYHVEKLVSEMEELSVSAAEAIDIVETELSGVGDDGEEGQAIRHSADAEEAIEDMDETDEEAEKDHDSEKPYDVPSPAFKEQAEKVFAAMVGKLMDALETYDAALDESGVDDQEEGVLGGLAGGALGAMAGGGLGAAAGGYLGHKAQQAGDAGAAASDNEDDEMPPGEEDDGEEEGGKGHVHVHHHQDVHVHQHGGDDDQGDEDAMQAQGDDAQDDDGDREMETDPDGDGDDDSSDQGDTDHDRHDLMAKMHALKSKRDQMMGSHKPPFRGGEEESAY